MNTHPLNCRKSFTVLAVFLSLFTRNVYMSMLTTPIVRLYTYICCRLFTCWWSRPVSKAMTLSSMALLLMKSMSPLAAKTYTNTSYEYISVHSRHQIWLLNSNELTVPGVYIRWNGLVEWNSGIGILECLISYMPVDHVRSPTPSVHARRHQSAIGHISVALRRPVAWALETYPFACHLLAWQGTNSSTGRRGPLGPRSPIGL